MTQRLRLPAVALAFAALGAAAVLAYRGTAPSGAITCPAGARPMARLELLLGAASSEADWQAFLDTEVTPRFPDGLTVLSGYGQWRNAAGIIAKESARVLLVWYAPSPDAHARIETIRAAYKARFAQESVMRVDGFSCVSF